MEAPRTNVDLPAVRAEEQATHRWGASNFDGRRQDVATGAAHVARVQGGAGTVSLWEARFPEYDKEWTEIVLLDWQDADDAAQEAAEQAWEYWLWECGGDAPWRVEVRRNGVVTEHEVHLDMDPVFTARSIKHGPRQAPFAGPLT